jgi:hypothetical protein
MKIILPHYVYEYWPHLLLLVCTLVIVLGWNTYVSVIGLLPILVSWRALSLRSHYRGMASRRRADVVVRH